jgi:2'-5' RNA ligase
VPRLRLGVALLVPPPAACEIDGLRRACGDGVLGRVPAHLTLVPPVNVNVSDLGRALAVLRAAAASVPGPIDAALGPVTSFAPETPVLYLAVGGDEEAHARLQRLRDNVFQPPLARPLAWPFVPHVTLADEMDADRIAAAMVALADYRADARFGHVTLLREASPGRVWSPVADVRLGPPAIVGRGGLPVELWWSSIADPEVTAVLAQEPIATPGAAEPFVVTARRDDLILGAARGWWRDGSIDVVELVVTEAAGTEDIERQLRLAIGGAS